MKWLYVKSLEELKNLGNFRSICKSVKEFRGDVVNINLRSWDKLYEGIAGFQKVLNSLGIDVAETPINSETSLYTENKEISFFTSQAGEYIFYLLELDGEARLKKLKVNKTHYINKEKATKWRNKIAKIIHPDICKHPKSNEAIAKLNELYGGMVDNEKY